MTIERRSMLLGSLGLAGGIAGLGTPPVAQAGIQKNGKTQPHIAIVGGGIIGCSVALHLARSGASVTLFEKNILASGATKNSLAWINPVTNNADYMHLRLLSMAHWRELDSRLKAGVIWGGSISWTKGEKKAAILRAKTALLAKTGTPFQTLPDSQAIEKLSTAVSHIGTVSDALYLPRDGHVDPVHATHVFAAEARRLGAAIHEHSEIVSVERKADKVVAVHLAEKRIPVDQVIFVGGTDTPHLMSMLGIPFELRHAPGLVVHSKPRPIVTRMVYEASGELEFKQYANGQIITSLTSGPPDLPQHQGIRAHQMQYPTKNLREWHGKMLLSRTAAYLPAAASAEPEEILLGFRPMPMDKMPVIGPVPGQKGCYMIVTHSGITLSPILGKLAAQEMLGSAPASVLAPFRPTRFIHAG